MGQINILQIILTDEQGRIIVFYVEIMNSKQLVKEKNGHVEQIEVSLPLLNVALNGSLR